MSSPSLAEVQRWFKSRVRPGESTAPVTPPAPTLNPQREVPGEVRLSVYAGGYLARIREALAEVYEAVHHIVGESAWSELSQAYVQRYPSHDYNLSFAGRHLPEFLTTHPLTQQLPFLPDLAALEWVVCQAFHAFDQPPLDAARLAASPLEEWEHARLSFQPSVGRVASTWPILDLWEVRKQPRETIDLALVNRPQRVLIFRQGLHVQCELLDERQDLLLRGLLTGRCLGDVCDELSNATEPTALPIADWFSSWAARGLLVQCQFGDATRS